MILLKEIIKEWNLEGLPPIKQREVAERIGKILYQALLTRSLDILSEREQDELDNLLGQDKTTPHEVLSFLKARIPTFDSLVIEERQALKEDLMLQSI